MDAAALAKSRTQETVINHLCCTDAELGGKTTREKNGEERIDPRCQLAMESRRRLRATKAPWEVTLGFCASFFFAPENVHVFDSCTPSLHSGPGRGRTLGTRWTTRHGHGHCHLSSDTTAGARANDAPHQTTLDYDCLWRTSVSHPPPIAVRKCPWRRRDTAA